MTRSQKDIFMYALAALVVTYSFAFLIILLFKKIPTENKDIIVMLSGILTGSGYATVIGYFFQTNKSSADKTDIIARSQPINQ